MEATGLMCKLAKVVLCARRRQRQVIWCLEVDSRLAPTVGRDGK